MSKNKSNELDILICEALKNEMNDIDISDEEIEEEWIKLQNKPNKIKPHKKNKFKKVAIIVGVLVGFTMINLPNSETQAWKVSNIINIFKSDENKTTVNHDLSIGEGIEKIDAEDEEKITTNSIEEVRNIVSFKFKELPYDFEDAVIQGPLEGEEILYLNYKTDTGKIRLIQMRQGLEFSKTVNVGNNSDVTKIEFNNASHSIIKINKNRTKVIWSSFGINHTIDIYYPIEIEKIKEIIKAME